MALVEYYMGPVWDNYVNMHLSNHGTDSEVSDVS